MFKPGDYLIYSSYGICHIDSTCSRKVDGTERTYFVLHPMKDTSAKIMTPLNKNKVFMRSIISPKEAKNILNYFEDKDNIEWIDDKKTRDKSFYQTLKKCDASENAKVLKALLIKEAEKSNNNQKLASSDSTMLNSLKQTLVNELSVSLDSTPQVISERIFVNL